MVSKQFAETDRYGAGVEKAGVRHRLTPKMVEWLTLLRDNGPASRPIGPIGHRCMVEGLSEWDYRWPDGSEMPEAEAREMLRSGRAGDLFNRKMLERITPAGRAALSKATLPTPGGSDE